MASTHLTITATGRSRGVNGERVRQLREQGLRFSEIGRRLGCSPGAARLALRAAGGDDPNKSVRITPAFIAAVKELRGQGLSYLSVSRQLGCAPATARDADLE